MLNSNRKATKIWYHKKRKHVRIIDIGTVKMYDYAYIYNN